MNTLQFPSHWSRIRKLLWLKLLSGASAVWETISGNPVSFTAKAAPLKQLQIAFSPVQDLHGYDSPWPAGGGVNKLPPMVDGTYEGNGVKAVVKNGIATLSGTTTSSGNALIIPLAASYTLQDGDYYHLLNSESAQNVQPSIENNSGVGLAYAFSPVNRIVAVGSGAAGIEVTRVRLYLGNNVTISGTYSPMICRDNTARSYSPYSNICPISGWDGVEIYLQSAYDPTAQPSISITIGQTVYSGTLDVLTGVVTVDSVKVTFDGTQNWSTGQAWRPALYSLANTIKPNAGNNSKVGLVCDHFKETTANESYSKVVGIAVDPNGYVFCVPTGEAITGAEMTTWFENNPTTVIFPLATPLTIQLTPQEVQSLAGDNTMWSNANQPITVEYRKN